MPHFNPSGYATEYMPKTLASIEVDIADTSPLYMYQHFKQRYFTRVKEAKYSEMTNRKKTLILRD